MQNSNLADGNSAKINTTQWSGFVTVGDTQLYTIDTGGNGIALVYLNGQFANMTYWKRVINELGRCFRHITYDERARGKKSGTSTDYSFESCINDIDDVLNARGIEKCIVIGWSYGAFLAANWASRNPARCLGAILVDGAQPYDWMNAEMEVSITKLFKRINPIIWLLRFTGITPRMTALQMADINIELGWKASKKILGPVMDSITVPTRYVLASGASFGSRGNEQEIIRTGCNDVVNRNNNVKISAKVKSNHSNILKKDYVVVANTIKEIVSLIQKK